ncbi:hypothetical protein [Levilactobacillus koreensis]|uniref:Uncharacterized protein n=1 Tax=Levilactobacillus koreensis TaxID=637971 RepID=A0AAC8UVF5_9LACO|nr:hypothetical protein [Levilactobacillus koreensis]AKP64622.1 hypothetical protein ABN16_06210 [Levilactobacillus koreensis]
MNTHLRRIGVGCLFVFSLLLATVAANLLPAYTLLLYVLAGIFLVSAIVLIFNRKAPDDK